MTHIARCVRLAITGLALVLGSAVLLAPAPSAAAADPTALVSAKRQLQQAVNRGDASALLASRAQFAGLSAADPADPLLHYYVAIATWRTLPVIQSKDEDKARQIGEDGLSHLETALKADPKFAEALALKGGLQGMMISLKPGSMMTLGPQSSANCERALEIAPGNPRAQLLNAIGVLHKPAMFGGGPEKAETLLEKAAAAFDGAAPADSTGPDWGHDDAWLWLGRAHDQQKDYTAAIECYRKALEFNPDNGWVRTILLPKAEKSVSGKGKKAASS